MPGSIVFGALVALFAVGVALAAGPLWASVADLYRKAFRYGPRQLTMVRVMLVVVSFGAFVLAAFIIFAVPLLSSR